MEIYHQPWRLIPAQHRGFGGRELDKFRGLADPKDRPCGSEAWVGAVNRMVNPPSKDPNYGCARVQLPDGREMFLFEAIDLAPEEILGAKHMAVNGKGLGILVKYLDAQRQYRLQCHPSRTQAMELWGSPYGKTESWLILSTRQDTVEPAYLLLGFRETVDRKAWEEAYFRDDIDAMEAMCHKIPVKPGEAYIVESGCPHAVGAGCFVIEVQEPSDITVGAHTQAFTVAAMAEQGMHYPLEDETLYNKKILETYVYQGYSEEENLRRHLVPRITLREGDWGQEELIIGPAQTSYFSYTMLRLRGSVPIRQRQAPQIVLAVDGEGSLIFDGGEMQIRRGDELFLPYQIPGLQAVGTLTLVLCHPEGVTYDELEQARP